jgi:hypothetical protein
MFVACEGCVLSVEVSAAGHHSSSGVVLSVVCSMSVIAKLRRGEVMTQKRIEEPRGEVGNK